MSHIQSKISTIHALKIDPIPAGRVFKAATAIRTDSVTVIVCDKGAIYSSGVRARAYYCSTDGRLEATLNALVRIGRLSAAAVAEHMADQKARREKDRCNWAAKDIVRSAAELGVKLTKAQQAKIDKATAA